MSLITVISAVALVAIRCSTRPQHASRQLDSHPRSTRMESPVFIHRRHDTNTVHGGPGTHVMRYLSLFEHRIYVLFLFLASRRWGGAELSEYVHDQKPKGRRHDIACRKVVILIYLTTDLKEEDVNDTVVRSGLSAGKAAMAGLRAPTQFGRPTCDKVFSGCALLLSAPKVIESRVSRVTMFAIDCSDAPKDAS